MYRFKIQIRRLSTQISQLNQRDIIVGSFWFRGFSSYSQNENTPCWYYINCEIKEKKNEIISLSIFKFYLFKSKIRKYGTANTKISYG